MNTFNEHRFIGSQRDGKLLIKDVHEFARHLRSMGDVPLEIIVQKFRKRRTARQNSWYWACIAVAAAVAKVTKDEFHEIVKDRFVFEKKVYWSVAGWVEFKIPGSTADYDTKEFGEFMDNQLGPWLAQEFKVPLLDPEKYGLRKNPETGIYERVEDDR